MRGHLGSAVVGGLLVMGGFAMGRWVDPVPSAHAGVSNVARFDRVVTVADEVPNRIYVWKLDANGTAVSEVVSYTAIGDEGKSPAHLTSATYPREQTGR